MSDRLFQEYSRFEDEVIETFNNRPFYRSCLFAQMSADQIRYYLLQIGFIAQNFIKWYETAKLAITDEEAKEVIRRILRSEIPRKGPTHQDDRFADLILLGLDPQTILSVPPTPRTQEIIDHLFQAVRYMPVRHFDLSVLVTLRVAGEILVAEQYKHIISHWSITFGLDLKQSRFFLPHMLHDRKRGGRGHTGAFNAVLTRLICNKEALRIAKSAAAAAEMMRSSIHNQFVFEAASAEGIPGIPAARRSRKK